MEFQISKEKLEQLNIKECFFEGLDIFKANLIQIFIAFIFVVIATTLSLGILGGCVFAGFLVFILKLKNKDSSATPTDVFSKFNILVPTLLVCIASAAISVANNVIVGGILGGIVAFLTGMLVSSLSASFATISIPLLASGKTSSAKEALQAGWDTFMLSPKTFFMLSVASHVLIFAGFLCLVIGSLVTIPLSICMMAVAAERLTKEA